MRSYLPSCSSKIPRLIEDVIPMAANTLALENGREAQVFRNLILRDDVVCAFGLTDDEFADL